MRLGKREILVGLVFLFGQLAHADDASAKIYEYFGVFNDKDLEQITNNIYAMPLLVGGGEGHLVWNDAKSATNSLRNTYKEIESRGYKRAVKSFQNKFSKLKEVLVSWDKQPYGQPKLQKLPLGRKKRISKW